MFDMTKIKKRYFDIKLKNGKILNIEAPKLKILKKILSLGESSKNEELNENDMKDLIEATTLALNKNKQNYKISAEQVEELFNIEELILFLSDYFEWVNQIQNSKN